MTDEPDLVQNALEDDERYRAYLKEAEFEHYELASIEHYKSAFEANPFIHLNDCSTCHSPVVIRCDGYMDSGRAKIFLYVIVPIAPDQKDPVIVFMRAAGRMAVY